MGFKALEIKSMIKLISSVTSIGLESTLNGVKGATVVATGGKSPSLVRLFTIAEDRDDVKPLDMGHPLITSSLDGKDVLVRYLHMPVTKDKDIAEALAFQAEPLLPFPIDQSVLAYQTLSKSQDGTELTLLAVPKEAIEAHLELWKQNKIEPEHIACVQTALCHFGNTYLPESKTYLIFHLQRQGITGVLMREGKLFASFALSEGLEALFTAKENHPHALPKNEAEWIAVLEQHSSRLTETLKRLQKEIVKMAFALAKEVKGQEIEGICVTGEAIEWEGLSHTLVQNLSFPLLTCQSSGEYSSNQLLSYAVPIGLALGSLPGQSSLVDFRQFELSYPHPWRRLMGPVAAYFGSILLLSAAFYFFGQHYLRYQEDQLRQTYLDLLAGMHKTHDQFEIAYLAKNPKAHDPFDGEIPRIEQVSQEELRGRLAFMQKEIQASPDSFPLYANIPRVSDVLAWLTQHPAVVVSDEDGDPEARLQIENFSYFMVKRPQQGKKGEKYQVKIELEFSSATPKWAREFHDALIAPNDWVDPKGEVKWNTNRGKYKTSFYLKDKTVYPST